MFSVLDPEKRRDLDRAYRRREFAIVKQGRAIARRPTSSVALRAFGHGRKGRVERRPECAAL